MERGRPTKLTKELQDKICDDIAKGAFVTHAAIANGVSKNTFMEWIARGKGSDPDREPNELYANFANAIEVAKAEACRMVSFKLADVDPKFWATRGPGRATADWEGFTEPVIKQEISGPEGGAIAVVNFESTEDATTYLRLIANQTGNSESRDTETEE